MDRDSEIIKTSVIGIVTNAFLVVFKLLVGIIANSIAIILDAVNNLSDMLSSIITIVGTKLASKKPDKEHPYGHGRIEYFAAAIIAVLVFSAGLSALNESIKKIIEPVKANYQITTLIVVIAAIFTKFFLGRYVIGKGKKINSQSLIASGQDALFDAIISITTLVAALISIFVGLSLEGYFGIFISLMIIKASIGIMKETVDEMIGTRIDRDMALKIKEKINSYPEVEGTYDLLLHTYGPSKIMGSAHIQVADNLTAKEIHSLTRKIAFAIYSEFGIILTLGIYASNVSDKDAKEIKEYLENLVKKYPTVLEMHGFYIDEETKMVSFDIIVDFEDKNPNGTRDQIVKELKEKFPEYSYIGLLDLDFSD